MTNIEIITWAFNFRAAKCGVRVRAISKSKSPDTFRVYEQRNFALVEPSTISANVASEALQYATLFSSDPPCTFKQLAETILWNDRRTQKAENPRREFSSGHDRKLCPQLKSLRLSHAVACDFNHFSEEN